MAMMRPSLSSRILVTGRSPEMISRRSRAVVVGQLPDVQTFGEAMLQDVGKGRARLGQLRRQAVHAHVGRVADDQLLLAVEHAQPLRHVVQGRVEPQVLHFQLQFLRQQLGLLGVQELLRLVEPRQRQSPEA